MGTSAQGNDTARSTAVVGLQWGDEGKGKVVDLLAGEHDAVVRYNGGANAGHSVVVGGERYALHLIPSGILSQGTLAVVGNGVVVDPEVMLKEIDGLRARGVDTGGLVVSDRAHVVMPYHKAEDQVREGVLKAESQLATLGRAGAVKEIGTTGRGIGPAYADKVQRATAIRVGDLLREDVLREKLRLICRLKNALLGAMGSDRGVFDADELAGQAIEWGRKLAPSIRDTVYLLNEMASAGKRLLFEGANATLLDVDHGTYPFVTSSSAAATGIPSGSGVPASRVNRTIGVMKAYSTRVGTGPLPTELLDATGQRIREVGREYGTTTGRPRRVGWLDLVAVRYSAMINGVTDIAITLLDVLAGIDEVKVCTAYRVGGKTTDRFIPDAFDLAKAEPVYEGFRGFSRGIQEARRRDELPDEARRLVDFVEETVGVRVSIVSVGPGREQTMLC